MITDQENSLIKEHHRTTFRGIWKILIAKKTFRKWPFITSVITSVGVTIFFSFKAGEDSFHILSALNELIMVVFPGLLGFSLGGYAIAVGFSNTDLLKNRSKADKYSIAQILSAVFAISILSQIFTTIVSFILSWIININADLSLITLSNTGVIVTNSICLLFLLFGSIYSLLLTPFVVLNLFSLSQLNSYYLTVLKIKEDREHMRKAGQDEKVESAR